MAKDPKSALLIYIYIYICMTYCRGEQHVIICNSVHNVCRSIRWEKNKSKKKRKRRKRNNKKHWKICFSSYSEPECNNIIVEVFTHKLTTIVQMWTPGLPGAVCWSRLYGRRLLRETWRRRISANEWLRTTAVRDRYLGFRNRGRVPDDGTWPVGVIVARRGKWCYVCARPKRMASTTTGNRRQQRWTRSDGKRIGSRGRWWTTASYRETAGRRTDGSASGVCDRSVRGSCETYTDPVAVRRQWTSARRHVNPRVSGPYARRPIGTQTKPTDFKTVVSPPPPPPPPLLRVDVNKSGRLSSSCETSCIVPYILSTTSQWRKNRTGKCINCSC
jgi:hypothetical protein